MPHYAALDIGTNNCRLLIAEAQNRQGFTILDSYADTVLLGDAIYNTGMIGADAIERCLEVLKICADKLAEYPAITYRAIATETCRIAKNSDSFLQQVKEVTGLEIDIISREEEARLACISCKPLVHQKSDYCLVFEIGGGSTQLSWVGTKDGRYELLGHVSLPIGILLASSRWGEGIIDEQLYQEIYETCLPYLQEFNDAHAIDKNIKEHSVQLISASGTPVSLACLLLKMNRYIRHKIDGKRFVSKDIVTVTQRLRQQTVEQRSNYPVIGLQRMRLAGMGAALTEIILIKWDIPHIYIADRGQREGILREMIVT